MKIKNIKCKTGGITLVSLVITIVVLMILAGIGMHSSKETIEKAKLEEVKTNMLLIQAKAREYVEEANFRIGIGSDDEKATRIDSVRQEIYVGTEKLRKLENVPTELGIPTNKQDSCYYLTAETKERWGLDKLENEEQYIIQFDETNVSVEIYYTKGYNGKYSLTDIDQL